ncbi:hypothetical protein JB92DRAFT_1211979 [Gautieria morchelliformis]|nr:hypothetical protein JB92DRAFT_1211979 [Gautieria morchelliformis]
MSLSKEQLKHDRINLGRLVQRLESVISNDNWDEEGKQYGEDAWVKAEGMAQKVRYARQLLLNVDYYEELDPRTQSQTVSKQNSLQSIRETLDKLDNFVDVVKRRLETEPMAETSYLSLVPLPTEEEAAMSEPGVVEQFPEAVLIPSDSLSGSNRQMEDPTLDLLPPSSHLNSELAQDPPTSRSPPATSLLSSSLQTHEELSNELSRMATQLKRNAQHFSDSLDKDKSLVLSAADVLEKNHDTMTKERVRLRDHRGKSFGTTWMVFGALLVVSIAWVSVFFVIRLT